jgi:hypothetical protein
MFLYMRLQNTLQPQDARDWPAELAEFLASIEPGLVAFRAHRNNQPHYDGVLETFSNFAGRFDAMSRLDPPLVMHGSPDGPVSFHYPADDLVFDVLGQPN